MDVTYRTPSPADYEPLAALGRRSFCATFAHLYSDADLATFLEVVFGPQGLGVELADPAYAFRVAEVDGAMVGFAKIGPQTMPYEPPVGRRAIELKQLYLDEAAKGTGIAQALMDWVLARARSQGAHEVVLSVWAENHRAQAFYRRYGFEEVGRYGFRVGEQIDDDRIMRLVLTEAAA